MEGGGKADLKRLNVPGMGTKLTSTQVTGRNTQGENLTSVSHCVCPKGTPQRLAHKQDEGAEAAHSLTSESVLAKATHDLTYCYYFMPISEYSFWEFDSKNFLLTTENKNKTTNSLLVFFKLHKHKYFCFLHRHRREYFGIG